VKDEETIVIETGIEVGEEVNLIAGPFKGLKAMVTKVMPARQRVAVLLEVLGMEREVEIAANDLLPDIDHPLVSK
jgi:transcriptional antiterminator RfaH